MPSAALRESWHCPECGERIRRADVGEEKEAADAEEESTYRIAPRPETRKRRRPSSTTYTPPLPVTDGPESKDSPLPLSAGELDGPMGLQRRASLRVAIDPPPERPFVSNVFGFPFQGSVVGQWMVISGGFCFFALLALVIISLYQGASSMISGVAAFIALPAFWIGLWTFSFAAACSLRIVEETAAGNNEIRDWMEGGWKEWVWQLFYLLYIAAIPLAVAWPIVKLTGRTYAEASIPLAVVEFLFFPIALLSALEQDSVWLPLSPPVLKSLLKVFGGWLVFYFFSACVAAVCGGVVYLSIQYASFALAFVIGPFFAAAMIVYFRLVGRLGWLIIERVEDTRDVTADEPSIPDETVRRQDR